MGRFDQATGTGLRLYIRTWRSGKLAWGFLERVDESTVAAATFSYQHRRFWFLSTQKLRKKLLQIRRTKNAEEKAELIYENIEFRGDFIGLLSGSDWAFVIRDDEVGEILDLLETFRVRTYKPSCGAAA